MLSSFISCYSSPFHSLLFLVIPSHFTFSRLHSSTCCMNVRVNTCCDEKRASKSRVFPSQTFTRFEDDSFFNPHVFSLLLTTYNLTNIIEFILMYSMCLLHTVYSFHSPTNGNDTSFCWGIHYAKRIYGV